ncbi:type II toxin-antitoxin system prevent-host-death family antitoxin [Dactylosporangium sp. NPDC000244]|uniref:type II toxin-antitoxin system Phd/YefM family antitoxin n=1 Tax=Dactylosporangium sp. NPDC000244 TaxID=3154365 RepID=UPI003317574A
MSQFVGLETARKTLGDLVDEAQQGTDTILTKNGKPVARLTAYTPEDTVTALDLSHTAAAVIFRARSNRGLTAAEFDYDIATHYDTNLDGVGGINGWLGSATYEIANEGHTGTADEGEARARQLWDQLQPELQAYARRCKDRKYSGWSSAAKSRGQRIAYAD